MSEKESLANAYTPPDKPTGKKPKISKNGVKRMKTNGKTSKEIAEYYGTNSQVIRNLLCNERKKERMAESRYQREKKQEEKSQLVAKTVMDNLECSPYKSTLKEERSQTNRAAGYFVAQCWKMGQSVDPDNIESLYRGLENYVQLCIECGMPMLVKTCHLALGLTSNTISRWRNGVNRQNDSRYKDFVAVMDSVIAAGLESSAASGSIDRVLTIWWEKSHFNMIEGDGKSGTGNDPLGEHISAREIAKKYDDLPD